MKPKFKSAGKIKASSDIIKTENATSLQEFLKSVLQGKGKGSKEEYRDIRRNEE